MRGNGRRAFTLIELMVVIALLGILTALIIPEMRGGFQEALLHSTARKLVDLFHFAGSQAITLNHAQRVRLDRKNNRYLIEPTTREAEGAAAPAHAVSTPGGNGELDPRITIEIRSPDEDAQTSPDEGPSLVSGADLGTRKRDDLIAFYPDGTADAVEVRLKDQQGFRVLLRINPVTGRVRITELGRE